MLELDNQAYIATGPVAAAGGGRATELSAFLRACVRARLNMIIGGGTNAGKTTLLMALANEIAARERLVTIEDNRELDLHLLPDRHPDVVSMETREANIEGEGAITAADLVRMGLRMHPSRVLVGEVRGAEIVPMLNAMNQGNDGSMCSIHASSATGVFDKIATYCVQAPERIDRETANLMMAGALDLVVFIDQLATPDGVRRRVSSILAVEDANGLEVGWSPILRPRAVNDITELPADGTAEFSAAALHQRLKMRLYAAGFDCRGPSIGKAF